MVQNGGRKMILKQLYTFRGDWKLVLMKAWSIKFIILSIVFQSIEILLPIYSDKFERGVFGILSVLAAALSFYSRFVVQRDVTQ